MGWIGVDLDGTLARHEHSWAGPQDIGDPIQPMVDRVKLWIADGRDVRIMTARVANDTGGIARYYIEVWCSLHLGKELPITCSKDYDMDELWDDRAIRVIRNTGERCCQ